MHIDNLAARVEQFAKNQHPSADAAEPLGHVVSVGGSQVVAQFTTDMTASGDDRADVTVGSFLGIRNRGRLVIGVLCDITLDKSAGGNPGVGATARVDLLGEIVLDKTGGGNFQRGVMVYPSIGSEIVPIGRHELQLIFDVAGPNTIDVGQLQQDNSLGSYVDVDDMVRKHFAIFGSTGAGKSSGVAVILREIMRARPHLRVLLIDPHNEYGHCFEDRVHVVRPGNLSLPFWLFNFDELVEVIFGRRSDLPEEVALLAELIPLAKNAFARSNPGERAGYRQTELDGGRYTVDTPVPYRMDELIALAESRMGKLENSGFALHYQRLIMRLNAVRRNPRYSFIFEGANTENDTMVDILCQLLRLDDAARPITIMQLAGFPAEVFDPIVSVLFRLAFEFGLWSDGAMPLLIVCEEAHHYANADRSIGFRPAREAVSRIAKEGRKYGVFLGLVSQRPAQIDPTLVSQCSTVFALRMANEDDQKIVHAAVSDRANRFLGFLASLGTREALAFGAGVPVATRLRFKQLPDGSIPKSEAGVRVDSATRIDKQMVTTVVARWRGIATSNKVQEPARVESLFLTR